MASDPTQPPAGQGPPGAGGPGEIDEAELQRRLEEQLAQVRIQDLILESVASILNLSARRIAKPDEKDLAQGQIGIDAVRALLPMIEEGPRAQVQEALSQVQMLYAREARGGADQGGGEDSGGAPGGGEPPAGGSPPAPEGPRVERPGGLWTPPGTS